MKARRVLFSLLALLLAGWPLSSAGPAESLVLEAAAGSYRLVPDPAGEWTIRMEGFSPSGAPGEPLLPSRVYSVLLPPDALKATVAVSVVSERAAVLPGRYDLKPVSPAVPMSRTGAFLPGGKWPRGPVYRSDDPRPEACARLVSVERMRKWLFARVAFTPLRYRARSGRLELIETAAIRIAYELSGAGPAGKADTVLDDLAPGLFHNFAPAREWYPPSPEGKGLAAGSDYVIVTTNAVRAGSSRLASFVSHKTRRGHRVAVVTESQWGSQIGQDPNHKPEKIRKWLQDNYIPLGIEYVLLIGDPYPDWSESVQGDVPMKLCWPWVRYPEWGMDVAPTDYYYADLTGNWDLNGNGYYGQYYDDTQPGGWTSPPRFSWAGSRFTAAITPPWT